MAKKKGISIAARKAKARRLQKWVAEQISISTGFPWGKDQPIESRPMGQSGIDVRLSEEVIKIFPFSVECKAVENLAVQEWIRQSQVNQLSKTNWILFFRQSHKPAMCIMGRLQFYNFFKNKTGNIVWDTYFHAQQNWFIEKWIKEAKYNSGKKWTMLLKNPKNPRAITYIMMEGLFFFQLYKKYLTETA